MFSNLIESGSHTADLKRKGKFFLGATLFYSVLLAATGVGSIYAYNARIDDASDLEILAIMRFSPADPRVEPEQRREAPQRASASDSNESATATRRIVSINTPYHGDDVAPEDAKDISARTPVRVSNVDTDPKSLGGPARRDFGGGPTGGDKGGPVVEDSTTTPPPPPPRVAPTPAPTPRKDPVRLSTSVLTGKAISMPPPPYPSVAKQIGLQGSVAVQVLIDEQGRVVSAKATTGHAMLMPAAQQAAYQARFSPTLLSGQPVKVTGVITYNFVINR